LVRTSLTSVGVPESAWRTRLKYLILSSVTGILRSPKYVDAYRQKSFRHTPSLGVPTSHSQLICLSQVRGLAAMAHAWFQKEFQPSQCWFNNLLEYLQGEVQLFVVWYVPRNLSHMIAHAVIGRTHTYHDTLSSIEFSPVFVMVETEV